MRVVFPVLHLLFLINSKFEAFTTFRRLFGYRWQEHTCIEPEEGLDRAEMLDRWILSELNLLAFSLELNSTFEAFSMGRWSCQSWGAKG